MPALPPSHKPKKSSAPRHMRPGNRQQRRAMHTGSKAWRALRAIVLEDELYKCRWCGKFGDHVDHIDGKAENPEDYRRENLQVLCASCHSRKTVENDGGFGANERNGIKPTQMP